MSQFIEIYLEGCHTQNSTSKSQCPLPTALKNVTDLKTGCLTCTMFILFLNNDINVEEVTHCKHRFHISAQFHVITAQLL